LTVLLPRVHGVEYDAAHRGGSFFIRTNDGARGFRLVEAPVADPSKTNWREIIPGREGVTIESVHAFANYLITEQRRNGLKEIQIHDFHTDADYAIDFPEPSYSAEIGHNYEFSSDVLRFEYTSLITPRSDIGTRRLWYTLNKAANTVNIHTNTTGTAVDVAWLLLG